MDLMNALYGRRSVRDYLDEPVDRQTLALLLDAAVQAPTAMHREQWAFVVVSGRGRLAEWSDRIKALALGGEAPAPDAHGPAALLADPAFNVFYNAPHLVAVCATEPGIMSVQTCCLAAENLMLAAHGQGLGTCWIGFAEGWLATPEGRAALALPDGWDCVAPIILGRPRAMPAAPGRKPALTRYIGD
ncbi:MAG: nitroreductase family protein [Proteobacteria bacterium]|nr:nitroreductase family protein [Pseudomonadota bacterium]